MLRIAVVGSRTFKDQDYLDSILDCIYFLIGEFTVVTGGADGADLMAMNYAWNQGWIPQVWPAKWDDLTHPDAVIKTRRNGQKYDALAGFRRNQIVVDNSDVVIAFWDGKSPGTQDTISRARAAGKNVAIFWPSAESIFHLSDLGSDVEARFRGE